MERDAAILAAVHAAIDEINEGLPEGARMPKSPECVLYGLEGRLDSAALVQLVVAIEQNLEDAFGAPVVLADEKAMSQRASPFRTVGSLTDYIRTLLSEPHG